MQIQTLWRNDPTTIVPFSKIQANITVIYHDGIA